MSFRNARLQFKGRIRTKPRWKRKDSVPKKKKRKVVPISRRNLQRPKSGLRLRRIRLMPGLRKEKEKLLILNKPVKQKHLPNRQCRKLRLRTAQESGASRSRADCLGGSWKS